MKTPLRQIRDELSPAAAAPPRASRPACSRSRAADGDADEVQPSLFSCAEFLALEQGRWRRRKPKPASASLFEWAFSLEQERETELVGAGH